MHCATFWTELELNKRLLTLPDFGARQLVLVLHSLGKLHALPDAPPISAGLWEQVRLTCHVICAHGQRAASRVQVLMVSSYCSLLLCRARVLLPLSAGYVTKWRFWAAATFSAAKSSDAYVCCHFTAVAGTLQINELLAEMVPTPGFFIENATMTLAIAARLQLPLSKKASDALVSRLCDNVFQVLVNRPSRLLRSCTMASRQTEEPCFTESCPFAFN